VNHIDKIRADIKKDFNEHIFKKGDVEASLSPSKEYRLNATNFSTEPRRDLTQVELYRQNSNEKIFDFFINDSSFFHGWVTANGIQYLICAEDIFGGQTIVDLTNLKMAGYSPNEDGFIWTDFHLSPNGRTLAAIGCYWACPYVIKLFDFTNPLNLPLTETKEIELLANNEIILGWLDNETIQLSHSVTETVKEDFDEGTHQYKIVAKPTGEKREINIYGK
jgi:hypothetical protein